MLQTNKIHDYLVKNWAEFIEPRGLIRFLKEETDSNNLNKITVSRFEINSIGYFIWADFDINQKNLTAELQFDLKGNLLSKKIHYLD